MTILRLARVVSHLVCDGQAGDTGPTVSNLEELESVYETKHLLLRRPGLEDDRKHAGGTKEVALPECVTRTGWERRMQDPLNFRPPR